MPAAGLLLLTWIFTLPPASATIQIQTAVNERMSHRQGAVVVLDVDSGQVLASYHMDVGARRLVVPGSTIKPFTLMALFDAGLLTEETGLFCPTRVRIGSHILDCSHPAISGPLDPILALANSCNYYFTTLAERLPLDALTRAFSQAGLASLTGKWPTEIPGIVQQPKSIQDLQLMSIGEQNIRVTPLALAEAYRALIRPLREPKASSAGLHLALKGLESVVTTGTGRLAASGNVQVAGKTGTAGGHAWFSGFAPAERPEIVIVVFLEQGTGGKDAAPIAGRLFDAYFGQIKEGR